MGLIGRTGLFGEIGDQLVLDKCMLSGITGMVMPATVALIWRATTDGRFAIGICGTSASQYLGMKGCV